MCIIIVSVLPSIRKDVRYSLIDQFQHLLTEHTNIHINGHCFYIIDEATSKAYVSLNNILESLNTQKLKAHRITENY